MRQPSSSVARKPREGNSLRILWIIGPFLIALVALTFFLPQIVQKLRLGKPQAVRFTKVWFSVQNTGTSNWTGGEAVLNGERRLRFRGLLPGQLIEIPYRAFGTNVLLDGVYEITVAPDGQQPTVHRPTQEQLELHGVRRKD